jgi:hypothetical protein
LSDNEIGRYNYGVANAGRRAFGLFTCDRSGIERRLGWSEKAPVRTRERSSYGTWGSKIAEMDQMIVAIESELDKRNAGWP